MYSVMFRRSVSVFLASVCSAAFVAGALVAAPAGGATNAAVPIVAGQPALVAAGDYLLTVNGLAASATTLGLVGQKIGGVGALLRNVDFSIGTVPSNVTAQVRVVGPTDVFNITTRSAPAHWSSITLTPATWGFVARGTAITSPTSSNVIWHGVNTPALHNTNYTSLFTAFPKAGAVRIIVSEECWDTYFTAAQQTTTCQSNDANGLTGAAAYQAWVDQAVVGITGAGRMAMLAVDWAGRDNPNWIPKAQTDLFGPDQQSLVVYQQLAQKYAGNPLVVFETTNEPKMNPTKIYGPNQIIGSLLWRSGGPMIMDNIRWNEPGVQQIVNQVRSAGANNLVLVNALSWGENLLPIKSNPILGPNVAYSYHGYRAPDNAASYPPMWDTQIKPLIDPAGAYAYASVLSEFGTAQVDQAPPTFAQGSAYLQSCINWAVKSGSSWLGNGWYPISWGQYGLLNSLVPLSLTSRGKTVAKNF